MRRTIAIHKFGGTSLGDATRIRNAARLLAAARRRRPVVAVASAMGGVTDVLLQAARDAERGRIGSCVLRFQNQHRQPIPALDEVAVIGGKYN